MAHGPELVQHVFLPKKKKRFYWNTATFICLHIIYDCFCATMAELNSSYREYTAYVL